MSELEQLATANNPRGANILQASGSTLICTRSVIQKEHVRRKRGDFPARRRAAQHTRRPPYLLPADSQGRPKGSRYERNTFSPLNVCEFGRKSAPRSRVPSGGRSGKNDPGPEAASIGPSPSRRPHLLRVKRLVQPGRPRSDGPGVWSRLVFSPAATMKPKPGQQEGKGFAQTLRRSAF